MRRPTSLLAGLGCFLAGSLATYLAMSQPGIAAWFGPPQGFTAMVFAEDAKLYPLAEYARYVSGREKLDKLVIETQPSQPDYYPTPDTLLLGHYSLGKKEEEWVEVSSGDLSTSRLSYRDGAKNGVFHSLYPNGEIAFRGWYKDDQLFGPHRQWDRVGRKVHEGYFRRGVKDGEWRYWHETG